MSQMPLIQFFIACTFIFSTYGLQTWAQEKENHELARHKRRAPPNSKLLSDFRRQLQTQESLDLTKIENLVELGRPAERKNQTEDTGGVVTGGGNGVLVDDRLVLLDLLEKDLFHEIAPEQISVFKELVDPFAMELKDQFPFFSLFDRLLSKKWVLVKGRIDVSGCFNRTVTGLQTQVIVMCQTEKHLFIDAKLMGHLEANEKFSAIGLFIHEALLAKAEKQNENLQSLDFQVLLRQDVRQLMQLFATANYENFSFTELRSVDTPQFTTMRRDELVLLTGRILEKIKENTEETKKVLADLEHWTKQATQICRPSAVKNELNRKEYEQALLKQKALAAFYREQEMILLQLQVINHFSQDSDFIRENFTGSLGPDRFSKWWLGPVIKDRQGDSVNSLGSTLDIRYMSSLDYGAPVFWVKLDEFLQGLTGKGLENIFPSVTFDANGYQNGIFSCAQLSFQLDSMIRKYQWRR